MKRARTNPWTATDLWGEKELPIGGRRKIIGYWREPQDRDLPDPRDLIDPDWDPTTRRRVCAYLSRPTFVQPYVSAGFSRCRFCKELNGSGELSDGVYVWPDGLVHYIRDHQVRLPDDVVEHIVRATGRTKSKRAAKRMLLARKKAAASKKTR